MQSTIINFDEAQKEAISTELKHFGLEDRLHDTLSVLLGNESPEFILRLLKIFFARGCQYGTGLMQKIHNHELERLNNALADADRSHLPKVRQKG